MHRSTFAILGALCAVCLVLSSSHVAAKTMEEKVAAYNNWINSLGYGFENCCKLAPVPGKGYGMIATREFTKDEPLVKFPPNEVLTYRTIVAKYPEWAAIDWGTMEESERVFPTLALYIQHEWMLNAESPIRPFLDLIEPENVDSTVNWNQDEMEEIENTVLFKQTFYRRAFVQQLWQKIEPILRANPTLFPPAHFTFENFRIFSYFIMSRSWGNLSNADNAIRVIPYADMWNHEIRAYPLGRTEDGLGQFIAHKDLQVGDEVSISYGNPLPENTLLLFGFVDTSEGASTQSLGELVITASRDWLPGRILGPWLDHFFQVLQNEEGKMQLSATITFPAVNLAEFLTYFRIAHLKIEEVTDKNLVKLKEHQSIGLENDVQAMRSAISWLDSQMANLRGGSLEEDKEYLEKNRASWSRRRIMAVEHRIRIKSNIATQKGNIYTAWMNLLIKK